jgi:hypothetical protein
MAPIALLAALAVLALAAGGCTTSGTGGGDSSGDFQGEQEKVASAVEDLQSAGSKGDQDRICSDLLADDLVDRLDRRPGGCRAVVDAALKDTDTSDLTVRSVQVSGATATARVATDVGDAPDQLTTLHLVQQDGRWKIDALS